MLPCQNLAVIYWLLIMEGISAISLGQDVSDEISCNMTCPSSPCDCELDGTITCDERNLKAIPQMPVCSTLVFLQNNQIADIGTSDFKGKNQVRIIDLTNNTVSELRPGIFDDLIGLAVLILHHNLIATVSERVFYKLRNLTSLDLSDNQITTLTPKIFSGNPLLTQLSLRNNNISELNKSWFQNKATWSLIQLSGNPWNCTCNLWQSYQYIILETHLEIQCNKSNGGVRKSMCITCHFPSLYRNIDLVKLHHFPSSKCAVKTPATAGGYNSTTRNISNPISGNQPDTNKTLESTEVNWRIYLVILGIFFLMVSILGLAMWLGSSREKRRQTQSLLFNTRHGRTKQHKLSTLPTQTAEEQ